MNYYQFNKKEILQKAKQNYSKQKTAEYYLLNKEAIKKGIKIWQTKKNKQKKNIKKTITRTIAKKKQKEVKKKAIITIKKEICAETCQKLK